MPPRPEVVNAKSNGASGSEYDDDAMATSLAYGADPFECVDLGEHSAGLDVEA
jgi:hypothetical protein